MTNNKNPKITDKQNKAVAEQLAGFFFEFWNNRHFENNPLTKEEQSHCPRKGFSEEFSREPRAMT